MMPAVAANRFKRLLVLTALRSRLFVIAAVLTALSELGAAVGATWKATHPTPDIRGWLVWVVVVSSWVYFALVLFIEWTGRRKKRAKPKR